MRGDLDRPPPIFSSSPPDEEARQPVSATVAVAQAPAKSADEAYYNELGGEIPKSDPAADIGESGLGADAFELFKVHRGIFVIGVGLGLGLFEDVQGGDRAVYLW